MNDKKDFYKALSYIMDEEQIQVLFNKANEIIKNNLNSQGIYESLSKEKPKDVGIILNMLFFENYFLFTLAPFLIEQKIRKETLLKFRDSLRANSISEFVKDYDKDDYEFLKNLIQEDDEFFDNKRKELYLNEVMYLNNEIDRAIPLIKVKKKKPTNIVKK